MAKSRILFVSQEITPYMDETSMSLIGRHLPQGIQERNREIRTFMPRYGHINERRNQLHEVIRLSGMNLIIDDNDHPLIIKVASIQSARMQVYFIDNEDYFHRKYMFRDKNQVFFDDNDERTLFYCKGVLETVKKLGWAPDIIHCHGWISSTLPLLAKRVYHENPLFSDAKVILSIYDDDFTEHLDKRFAGKLKMEGVPDKDLKYYKEVSHVNMIKNAIDYADALVFGSDKINPELVDYAVKSGKPLLPWQGHEDYIEAYNNFYDEILVGETVIADR